ncbi:MAG: putative quinol monooxygenase [Mycetocola sp.]
MSDPIMVTAVFTPAAGALATLADAIAPFLGEVHSEQGCELYALHRGEDGSLVMLEKWTTVADLDAHAAGDIVARLDAAIEPLLAAPTVVTRLHAIPGGSTNRGAL